MQLRGLFLLFGGADLEALEADPLSESLRQRRGRNEDVSRCTLEHAREDLRTFFGADRAGCEIVFSHRDIGPVWKLPGIPVDSYPGHRCLVRASLSVGIQKRVCRGIRANSYASQRCRKRRDHHEEIKL